MLINMSQLISLKDHELMMLPKSASMETPTGTVIQKYMNHLNGIKPRRAELILECNIERPEPYKISFNTDMIQLMSHYQSSTKYQKT
jgi:hypothetical protein